MKPLRDAAPTTRFSIAEDETNSVMALTLSMSSSNMSWQFICSKKYIKKLLKDPNPKSIGFDCQHLFTGTVTVEGHEEILS